ncbi:unnamed protein product [Hydatigera taeniaeformis]|uniref:RING-type domain-containing protein n=1 Tax=Hydatigena taeniaeformis TaxID=6205 RepID=A0A0R3WHZ4_HYDTA|nr:unnamed protein product [Hydatigera taeniaeformis]
MEIENELELLRRQREQGRSELVTTLCETTKRIDDLICHLHQKQRVLRKNDQPQSSITHPYSTNAVLDASRTGSMGYSVIGADDQEEIDSALQCVLISRRADQAQLAVRVAIEVWSLQHLSRISPILFIEDGQKMKAFECLQQQRNLRRQQIIDNIQLVERELCRLSRVERERKAFQNALILGQFSERRRDLVHLLSDLQRQKDQRESELYEFLKGLEEQRERDQTFYWLVQYQRLMDRTPLDLRKVLPNRTNCTELYLFVSLSHFGQIHLALLGYDHICIPVPAPVVLVHMGTFENRLHSNFSQTKSITSGLHGFFHKFSFIKIFFYITSHSTDRIMLTSAMLLKFCQSPLLVSSVLSGNENESESTPNDAGNDRMASPSAPPAVVARFENECCICQDAQCSIIFLPCGHVCCCKFCSVKVVLCPLCRSTVEQHIQIS